MEEVKYLTTGQVVECLRRLGLSVAEKQLANDTADGFLPPRIQGQVLEGRGRTGLWAPWMVIRAERLYRLRRRRDAAGRPMVYGDTLRILLFLRDGWGWSAGIRELCLLAYEKSIAATLAPVRRYVRGVAEREKVEFALEAHDAKLIPAERYAAGMIAYGQPLEGGSIKGLFKAAQVLGLVDFPAWFVKSFAPLGIDNSVDLAAQVAKPFALGRDAWKALLENFGDYEAQRGAAQFMRFITRIRSGVHRAAIAEGRKDHSTNVLTFFGFTQRPLEQEFRAMKVPRRITPAQALALMIGISMISDYVLRLGERVAHFAINVARKRLGMEFPSDEEQLVPFTIEVMQRVFGVNPFAEQPTTPK